MANMFLKFEGKKKIEGESAQEGFQGQLEVQNFSYGVTNPRAASVSGAGGHSTGTATVTTVNFTRAIDKASPALFESCCSGATWDKVTLTLRRTAEGEEMPITYMTVALDDAMLDNYSISGMDEAKPVESFALAFKKITWDYTVEGDKSAKGGSVSASWDAKAVKR
jgi:type VI secretion system secreted protein Hcp